MRTRILRLLALAAGAFVVAWPLLGLHGDETSGFSATFEPSARVALWTFGIGAAALLLAEGRRRAAAAFARPPDAPRRLVPSWAVSPGAAAGAVAVLAALPFVTSGYWTGLLLETLVFVTIASGLNITIGMAGLLVLGHAAFWGVGAYTFSMLVVHAHWNFWLAFPAAGAAAAAAGFLIGLPALRLRGDYLAVVTLGFGEVVRKVLKNEAEWTGGDAGLPSSEIAGDLRAVHGPAWLWQPGAGGDERRECYWFALGLAVVCIACIVRLTRSRFGRALVALREDETAARCMGIDTTRIKLLAFTSSAMWAGLAGVVHPIYVGQVTPDLFDFTSSVLFLTMVVLGGLGSIAGPVVGAALLWIAPALLRNHFPEFQESRLLVFGLAMAAMMVVRPQGIVGAADGRVRGGAGRP